MGEEITMAEVLYVPVDDEGEPARFRWDPEDGGEAMVSVFGDFWRAKLSPEGKGKAIRALSLEDLQELLRGPWSDVGEIGYHPGADGYIKSRDTILQAAIEGVAVQ